MRYLFSYLLIIVLGAIQVNAQPVPTIIKRLYHEPRAVLVSSYNYDHLIDIPDLPGSYNLSGQAITKTTKGVFLNPLGTGRIYQLVMGTDSLKWQRIDSTLFFGYNFGSLFFSLDTTLYSFAGQGFFNHNGNLRYYNESSHEWDAQNLSASIFWLAKHNLFETLDTTERQLYIEALALKQDHALKNRLAPEMNKTLWKLDIDSGEWRQIGTIIKDMATVGETSFGTLVNFNLIVDLKKNKIYRLSKNLSNQILNIVGNSTKPKFISFAYCIDSTLYLGDRYNFIDSVVISRNELIATDESFYNPIASATVSPISERHVFIGLIAGFSIIASFLFYKLRQKKEIQAPQIISNSKPTEKSIDQHQSQVVFKSSKLLDLLNEREKLLLEFIYKHSLDERLTTIEEINKVIGAAQRNPEVQKRLRSDLIGSINDKLEIIAESKFNVIDKQRSEFDKRSFEYFIRPEHMSLVEKVLGKKP
jgi:hypothetical protein